MIDVNAITELLIQHSQSTGFEKSLEMLTQTLRHLTDANATGASASSHQLPSANPLENLLMKRLQTPIHPTGVLPTAAAPAWFNPAAATAAFSSAVPPFYPSPPTTAAASTRPPTASLDYHSQQQYQNQRH